MSATKDTAQLNTSLSSLAMLSLKLRAGADYLDYLRGFVLESLRLIEKTSFNATDVQGKLLEKFGLQIPVATLVIYLGRLQKEKVVKKTPEGLQYEVVSLPSHTQLTQEQAEATTQIDEVLRQLHEYAKRKFEQEWSTRQAAIALAEFVRQYSIDFVRHHEFKTPLPEPGEDVKSAHYIVSSFIRESSRDQPQVFASLVTLVESHILANALLCPDLKSTSAGLNGTMFLLDTRLLLKALDLESEVDTRNTRTLFASIRKLRGQLRLFPETKSELRSVLSAVIRAYQNGTARGPIAIESRKRGRGLTEVIIVESRLDELLSEMEILTLPSPTLDERSYRFQIDEVALQKDFEEELGYPLTRAAETDIACVRFIRALRKGRQVSRVEDAGFIFLTTNAALSRAAFNFERDEFKGWVFSTVVTDFHLSHLVWLKMPVKSSDLAKTELLASCYAAMRPPQTFWKEYLLEVDRLKSQGVVTPRDHELLRLSLKAPDTLMEVTQGDVEGLTETNIREILERLQKEYTAEKDVEITAIREQKEEL